MREVPFVGLLPVVTLIVLAMGVVGLVLLRRGLRGRRIGDHPVCRKCDFDLFGLPDDQARCPECGSDLAARGAVQRGHRRRRMPLVTVGASLLVLFALIAGSTGVETYRRVEWQRVKPIGWLAREARSGSAAAWTELTRRAGAGSLSGARAQPIVADALAWQKDLSRRWEPAVGDFVEAARAASLITDEQWATYARQAPQISLRLRAKVRKGDRYLPGDLLYGPTRAGSQTKLSMRVGKPIDTDDPLIIPPSKDGGGGYSHGSLSGTGSMGVYLRLEPKAVGAAALGKRTTRITLTSDIRESWDTPGVEWTQEFSGDWELVAADEETVELVPDDSPELRKQIEAALKVDKLEVRPRSAAAGAIADYVSLDLKITALPLPLSYEVFLRSGQREWKLTTLTVAGATHYGTGGFIPDRQKFDASRVDVIFRPSPAPARQSVSITRMWNGEIVIPDVAVRWPATQPATSPR